MNARRLRLLLTGMSVLAASCAFDADGDGILRGSDCDDHDAGEGLAATWYPDADGDGYGADTGAVVGCAPPAGFVGGGADCDDGDPASHPGADEVWYDGQDQACDGGDDFDADGDGWAASRYGGEDCDDADPGTHPGAVDAPYDGLDSDCDGGSDYDLDGDGWDSEAFAGGGDCDDADPDVHPSAAERYYDGVDQDCDGGSDYDLDGDGWDSEVLAGGGDCVDEDPDIHPGAFEWHDGDDDDCDGTEDVRLLSSAESAWSGENAGDGAATALAGGWDLDGDGVADVLAGAGGWRAGAGRGAVYVVPGAALGSGAWSGSLWGAAARLGGLEDGAALGSAVAAGDLDGDGWADVLAGAPGGEGAAWVWRGPLAGESLTADADLALLGEEAGGLLGQAVAGGADLDGDGLADLAVGMPGADGGRGMVAVLRGDLFGAVSPSAAAAVLAGSLPGEAAGGAAVLAGDVDGDGLADLLVGAPARAGAGGAYLLRAPIAVASLTDADTVLLGRADGDAAGAALAAAGDVDGDGLGDVLVGAPGADERATGGGAAYLFSGPVGTGLVDLGAAMAVFGGDIEGILAGTAVAGAGDVDGDGFCDVLFGAPGIAAAAAPMGGAYLVLGPVAGSLCTCGSDARFYGASAGDRAGTTLAGPGDLDGDGFADLVFGAAAASPAGAASGALYLLRGSAR